MKKIRLIYHDDHWCNLTTVFLEPVWDRYFERVPLSSAGKIDKKTDIIYANFSTAPQWIDQWRNDGFKIVIDHLWDSWLLDRVVSSNNVLVVRNPNWSWYNESLWYDFLGYNHYKANTNARKHFLLQMNLKKPHRDMIFEKLKDSLVDNAIYSYHGEGIVLQNANDISATDTMWQRYIDPDWYDSTHFSLVVESSLQSAPMMAHSEKSYKPMAFYHPTITWGPSGLLGYLKEQGFEFFSHRINENYDSLLDDQQRLLSVIESVKTTVEQLDKDPYYFKDSLTGQILEHNRNHFYNRSHIMNRFDIEIINPILEFSQS